MSYNFNLKKNCICRYAQKLHRERLRNNQNISKYTWLKKKKKNPCSFLLLLLLLCAQLCLTLCRVAHQKTPLSMGFSRQQYWSGLPFPTPGDLPDPGIKPMSLCLHIGRWVPNHWATREVPEIRFLNTTVACLPTATTISSCLWLWFSQFLSLIFGLSRLNFLLCG